MARTAGQHHTTLYIHFLKCSHGVTRSVQRYNRTVKTQKSSATWILVCTNTQVGPVEVWTPYQPNLVVDRDLRWRPQTWSWRWAVLVMMCKGHGHGHEKNQQAPCLEVVGPYGEYCLIRQLVVLLRQLGESRSYLRSDNFSPRSKINKRFSQSGAPQAGLSSLRVWKHADNSRCRTCSWSPRKGAHLPGLDLYTNKRFPVEKA